MAHVFGTLSRFVESGKITEKMLILEKLRESHGTLFIVWKNLGLQG